MLGEITTAPRPSVLRATSLRSGAPALRLFVSASSPSFRHHFTARVATCRAGSGSSDSNGSASDSDDLPPQLSGDWREFRARLVAHERLEARQAAAAAAAAAEQQRREAEEQQREADAAAASAAAAAAAAPPPAAPQQGGRWAHLLAQPEKGCLLVARRPDMRFFTRSVVFLMWHEDRRGSIGLALNCPSEYKVADADVGKVASAFRDAPIYVGGPVENSNVFIALHTCGDCKGANEIIEGVYSTDVRDLSEYVSGSQHAAAGGGAGGSSNGSGNGGAAPSAGQGHAAAPAAAGGPSPELPPVKVIAGYSGWGPHQLASELESGSWYVVAASRDVLMDTLSESQIDKSSYWEHILRLAGLDGQQQQQQFGGGELGSPPHNQQQQHEQPGGEPGE